MTPDPGPTLALAAAKATMILAAGIVADALLRRRSAALRHLVLGLTLAATATVGLLAPVAPEIRLAVPAWLRSSPTTETSSAGSAWAETDVVNDLSSSSSRELPAISPAVTLQPQPSWTGAWLLGFLFVAAWLVLGHVGLARLVRRAAPLPDEEWQALAKSTAARYGIAPVRLLRSRSVGSPLTWGLQRPVVLVPEDAPSWPAPRRRAVLAHELAHVARHDTAWQLLSGAVCAIYWFHPLAWWVARRLREESERACDDRALARGTNAAEYAQHLLDVARGSRGLRLAGLVAIGMARPSHLEGRLLAVLDEARARHAPRLRTRAAVFLAASALVLSVAGLTPAPRAATGSPDDGKFERSVDASPGGKLEIRLDSGGDVDVQGWDEPSVQVRGQLAGDDWEDTRVSLEKVSGGVRLVAKQESWRRSTSTSHEFEIRVPRRYDLALRSAGGPVVIRDLEGTLRGETGGGDMVIEHAKGSAQLFTGGGDIQVTDCDLKGSVSTGGGEVTLTRVRGGLRGASGGGKVTGREVTEKGDETGPLVVSNAGGDIDFEHLSNDAQVSTGGGDIHIGRVDGSIDATTGGGDVELGPVTGSVEVSTGAGDVSVWLEGEGNAGRSVDLSSGSGSVVIELPPDVGATFELETAYTDNFRRATKIESDWDLVREETSKWDARHGTPRKFVRAHGEVGGGGMRIRVKTVNGDVTVHRRP